MTGMEVMKLYNERQKSNGPEVIVRFTDLIGDSDTRFEKGMVAKIVDCVPVDKSIMKITVLEKGLKRYNVDMERPVWYDADEIKRKYSELYDRDENKTEEFYDNYLSEVANFEIVNDKEIVSLIKKYCREDTDKTYMEWVEDKRDHACKEDLKSRLIQAIIDYGNSDDAFCYDAEDMAAYLMEVIDELH